jgi:hypothetical protein
MPQVTAHLLPTIQSSTATEGLVELEKIPIFTQNMTEYELLTKILV